MSLPTRREFLTYSAAAVTIAGTKSSGRVLGANDTIRVAVCGINGRGTSHIAEYLKIPGVQITYLVDPDKSLWGPRSKSITDKYGVAPKCVADVREALEDKELDAISIATPNHWHSLMTIWAVQAGKDVYVEKPMSHNLYEGRRVVEAAKKYKRIVQHGTQQRSSASRASEIAAVQSGKYGKLLVSKGYCCKPRWSIGKAEFSKPPENLDFNVWLGPARQQPYHKNLVHYNWHWFWDFGNGDIGNQGVHEYDVARWAIKDATLPTKVWSLGGRFGYEDQGETPNTQMTVMEFGDVLLVFEVRGLVENKTGFKLRVANEYYTTEGRIENGTLYPKNGASPVKLEKFETNVTPGGAFGSFIAAIRSGKPETCNAGPEHGHFSSGLCQLGNISYRLGEQVKFDGKGKLGDNREVVETFKNLHDNLTGVGVKLDATTYRLGKTLTMDPISEHFTGEGAKEANAYLTREYRKPFVVSERV